MQLKTETNSITTSFEVILLDDPNEQEFDFLIIMPGKACMIAKKIFPSGKWIPGSNSGAFSKDLQEKIFTAIDNVSFQIIAEERLSIDELNQVYTHNLL